MVQVIALIKAYEVHWETVKKALKSLESQARKEDGCLEYAFFQDTSILEQFYCIEKWESAESLDKHAQGYNVQACIQKIESFLAEPVKISIIDNI